ncbi:hypothetical protein [Nocardioides terrisoli]|uniref:hypothetical protein n=1 Tax=Nocardioides terrisoli TaxID=3388267 RepID=UPI00287B8932|nr:hypothetical protein [Nocardioides marmorisolisilvae]
MRRRPADAVITEALRHLDPARGTHLTNAEVERANAAFARIVAAPEHGAVPVEPDRPRRGRGRLLVGVGVVGAGIAIPWLLLGGGTAYGSWTPRPEPLTSVTAARAATTCRVALGVPDRGEHVAVAERRGEWTYLLLAGPGTEAVCLMPREVVGRESAGGEDFFGSYDTDAGAPPTVAPDHVAETTSMEGSTHEGWFSWVQGYVGSDVTGVTVHTSSGLDIEASVAGNRFAAWWPSHQQSSDHPAETWSYTVHLADGSARPAR